MANERVDFRILRLECCNLVFCWVNPRLPNYCPECGKKIYPQVKSWVAYHDSNAHLKYEWGELKSNIKD